MNDDHDNAITDKEKSGRWKCAMCDQEWPEYTTYHAMKARIRASEIHPNIPCKKECDHEYISWHGMRGECQLCGEIVMSPATNEILDQFFGGTE